MAVNPLHFIREVRGEAAKVVWPTRRETVTTTIIVFIMAVILALFFFLVDQLVALGLQGLLALAS
ncbi:MAG TPA: preprotein translocase subunit SecE [Paracoccaceae bacterium]|nr:preprotein translocase subunit SecE [Paracoccaceae bacterium]